MLRINNQKKQKMKTRKSFKKRLAKAYGKMVVALCIIGGQPLVFFFADRITVNAYKKLLGA